MNIKIHNNIHICGPNWHTVIFLYSVCPIKFLEIDSAHKFSG
jgi:hypothetical protein